jgi:NAD(P)-dependent dehydrogenase (short-subunit alcohol dehydrogenase family)
MMNLSLSLEGKIAIVTGSAMGIGKAMAQGMASVGATVIIADIAEELAQKTADEIISEGGNAVAYKLDVTDSEQYKAFVDAVVERFGRIDVLVNNAGLNRRNLCVNMPEEDWNTIINVNLTGVWIGCKMVAPVMIAQGSGKIINTCSIMGYVSLPELTGYSASKGGVLFQLA